MIMERKQNSTSMRCWYVLLGLVLLVGLYLRCPYPSPGWSHVDERAFLLRPLGFWSGDLNPHFFNYPTLQLYLTSLLYYVYYLLLHRDGGVEAFLYYRYFVDGHDLLVLTRFAHTLLSVFTVGVVAYLGRRLYGGWAGLLSGLVLSVMPLSVRFAHLAITDTPSVLWVGLALLWSVRIVQDGRRSDYLLSGLFVGLAGSTKYPSALVLVSVLVACFLRRGTIRHWGMWGSCGVALLTFCVTSPYVLLNAGSAWASIRSMSAEHLLSDSHGTESSWWYHLRYSLGYGVGYVGLLYLAAGVFWRGRGWRVEERVLLSSFLVFGLFLLLSSSVFMRYALPLSVSAPVLLLRPLYQFRHRLLFVLGVVLLLLEPAYRSWQTRALLSGEDTREQAVGWVDEHAESGNRLVHFPFGAGKLQVLSPASVYVRRNRFLLSYSASRLRGAYDWLRQQGVLPPLYLSLSLTAIRNRVTAEDTEEQALLLWYQHPLCAEGEEDLAQQVAWQVDFSPGETADAIFDQVDFYFLPIGGFGGMERTGPGIRIGKLRVKTGGGRGSAQDLFEMLYRLLVGKETMQKGDWKGAIGHYQKVLRTPLNLEETLTPTDLFDAYYSIGLALKNLERFDLAVRFWEEAAHSEGAQAFLFNYLGFAYAKIDRFEAAIDAWNRAIELEPGNAGAYYSLGNALYGQKRYGEAIDAWEKAIELDPDHSQADQIRQLLQTAP